MEWKHTINKIAKNKYNFFKEKYVVCKFLGT